MSDQRPDIHDTRRLDIHEVLNQLCAQHTALEKFEYERVDSNGGITKYPSEHQTTVPALIDQLRESVDHSTGGQGGGGTLQSKPAARLEAIDAYTRIDIAAARWVRDLGEDDPGDTIACIRKLAGLRGSAESTTVKAIDADIHRWWTTARILTGWDSPALTPYNTCPPCGSLGTLRVRPAEEIAVCTSCAETWTPENIGMLARHIKKENGEEAAA